MSESKGGNTLEIVLASTTATGMIAHQVAAKAARDSLFLTHFDVTTLPMMMIAGALGSAFAVLLMAQVLARFGPARLIPGIYGVSGLVFLAEWFLMEGAPRAMTVVYYLHISILGSILISGFWSVINERYDPYRGKQVIARLAAAATLGGLLGGLAASAVAAFSDTRSILLLLSGIHLFCGLSLAVVARGVSRSGGMRHAQGLVLEPLKRSRLIRRMAVLVLLMATITALLDYLLKSAAAAELSDAELIHFFSTFYVAVGLGGFLLQTFVGGRSLRWLGIGGTMAALPALVLTGGLFAFVVRQLMTVTILRAGASILNNSFFRAGFESLYTPIPAEDKRAGKLVIDVGAERMGDLAGSLLIMGILLFPLMSEDLLLMGVMLLSVLALLLIVSLHRGYVSQLADNLREGTQEPEDIVVGDATTRRIIATTQTTLSRAQLLREIADLRRRTSEQSSVARAEPAEGSAGVTGRDPILTAIADLRSGDHGRISRALVSHSASPALLPHIIPLLAREDSVREVFRVLRPAAYTASGQLVDALLERRMSPVVRRRLPLVLARAESQLAVQGLVESLGDTDADVRLRCGKALARLSMRAPRLLFPEGDLWRAVRAELNRLRAAAGGETVDPGRLGHLFDLLGILYGPETVDLCYGSLLSREPGARGTALEYLESSLPPEIRDQIWPLIGAVEVAQRTKRSPQAIAKDLLNARRRSAGVRTQPPTGRTP